VLTGAGVSAECGIETFRGEDGTWSKVNIEDVATLEGFMRDPGQVWRWYDERRIQISKVEPNPAHFALAGMEDIYSEFTLITQNIDGLHERAGSRNIIELHGNIWGVIDMETGEKSRLEEVPLREYPPRSRDGNLLRPDVVWFGEMLPEGALEKSFAAANCCDVCLVVGTSAVVQPAATIPLIAKRAGAYVVEFTLQPTEITGLVDHTFYGKAGETLPVILESILG
jgi:NAD-dependent deacetylase